MVQKLVSSLYYYWIKRTDVRAQENQRLFCRNDTINSSYLILRLTTSFPLYVQRLPLHSAGNTRTSLLIPPLAIAGG